MQKELYREIERRKEAIRSQLTDEQFFGGREYLSFVKRRAENFLVGVCDTLKLFGYSCSKKKVNTIKNNIDIHCYFNPQMNTTASCASNALATYFNVTINAGTPAFASNTSRSERHNAILGMMYHELGHILFTDFRSACAWELQMRGEGNFYPKDPANIQTINGSEMSAKLKSDPLYRELVSMAGNNLINCLEDANIEYFVGQSSAYAGRFLSAMNELEVATAPTLQYDLQNREKDGVISKTDIFQALFSQILLFAKHDELYLGEIDSKYEYLLNVLNSCIEIVDEHRYTTSAMETLDAANQLLVVLYPFIDDAVQEQQNQPNQQQQGQNSSQQSGQQTIDNIMGGINPLSNHQESKGNNDSPSVFDDQKSKNSSGNRNNPDKNQNGQSQNPGDMAKSRDKSANQGQDQGNAQSQKNGTGAGNGESSSNDAAKRDVSNLENDISDREAKVQYEQERTEKLNKDFESFTTDFGDFHHRYPQKQIIRAADVSNFNKEKLDAERRKFEAISRILQKEISKVIKERKEGGKLTGLRMGKYLECRRVIQGDGKYFSRRKLPTDSPKLAVGVLVDESGSTSGTLINAAVNCSLVLEDFCRNLEIEHIITGYTTGTFRSYAEPNTFDASNKYRITGMHASGGTPTCAALSYMGNRMKQLNADVKLLFVITDGQSGDNFNIGTGTALTLLLQQLKKEKIMTIAAGIGRDRGSVEKEFGSDAFLDISNLELMPEQITDIIKSYLW